MSADAMMLPPIPLAALPERTKDFVLALCNQRGCSPAAAIKSILDSSAASAGFLALPSPQPEGDGVQAALAA